MARPSKYTPETVQKLCQAIELGATYEMACNYAGIDASTFNKWRDPDSPHHKPDLVPQVKLAEGKAAVKWLAKIETAAAEHWQAAAWKLERRYPNDFGKTVQEQQHTGKDGAPFEIVIRRDND